jgi:hypothetical protein
MNGSDMNSKITYMYRDAHNFKNYGEFVVRDLITIEEISPYLIDGEFFVPEDIGVDILRPIAMNDWDHQYHEIVSIEPTSLRSRLSSSALIASLQASRAHYRVVALAK